MKKVVSLIVMFVSMCIIGNINANNSMAVTAQAAANQVQAAHILVPTEQEAIKIREEITSGSNGENTLEKFTDAAKKYSKCPSGKSGGFLGWFRRGDMVPEFENAAFNLPNGIVSEPVKTQFGYHLIYVISKK